MIVKLMSKIIIFAIGFFIFLFIAGIIFNTLFEAIAIIITGFLFIIEFIVMGIQKLLKNKKRF